MNTKTNFHGFIAGVAFNKAASTIECMVNTQHGTKVLRHKVGSKTGLTATESAALWKELKACMADQDHVFFMQRNGAQGWPTFFDSVMIAQEEVPAGDFELLIAD